MTLFNDKIKHNKLYDNFLIRWMVKHNIKSRLYKKESGLSIYDFI
jgi:hypothetical protein